MSNFFDGIVKDGKVVLYPYFEDLYHRTLRDLEGKKVRLHLARGNQRSLPQNKWLWGVAYRILAEHSGHTEWEIHEFCKLKFLPKVITLSNYEEKIIGRSTTELSTTEFTEYKEKIQQLAAELGCIIPDPQEVIEDELSSR